MGINLGDLVFDKITGFLGIATARCVYLFGETQILISPQDLEGGKPSEPQWFAIDRVQHRNQCESGKSESSN
jgi:hypothetical protein